MPAYEPRPGSLSLFKNDRKENDSQPGYKGDGLLPDGTPVWISAWVKDGAKGKFFSISIQLKDAPAKPADSFPRGGGSSSGFSGGGDRQGFGGPDPDDGIPFISRDGLK